MRFSSERIRQKAHALGFDLVGITPAQPSPTLDAYLAWVEAGMHGSMGYLARPDRIARRRDLNVIVPDTASILLIGRDYRSEDVPDKALNDPLRGRIASYAWGLDYHDILTPRLKQLATWLEQQSQHSLTQRVYVDTGAVLERSHAQQAGLGFIGKNTMLIHSRRGSYFFLGEIITTLEFDDYDTPQRATMCGTCTRCLHACPTDAFPHPYVLDARRCISYHTIENKGWIPRELRASFGNWIFGCDICQEVCPFQRFSLPSQERAFYPPDWQRIAPALADVLALDEAQFLARYGQTPLARPGRERLVRNACIAAGNSQSETLLPALTRCLNDPSAMIRGHAAWALTQLNPQAARPALERLRNDPDEAVAAEARALLEA